MIQIFAPKSGSDAVKQEELPDFFTILFFVINFCFTNQLCFDLEIWTAWIRQRRENLNQYKYGPVNRSNFKLRYGILILVHCQTLLSIDTHKRCGFCDKKFNFCKLLSFTYIWNMLLEMGILLKFSFYDMFLDSFDK